MINELNKNKILLAIIAILLISNFVLLGFFLQKKDSDIPAKRPDKKAYIAEFLQKEIGFNQQQLLQYDTLSERQQNAMKGFFDNMRNKKKQQFQQLITANFTDTSVNRLADESAATQKKMEMQMFGHIKAVRELCTPDQLPRFDTSFVKIFNRRGGDPNKKIKK